MGSKLNITQFIDIEIVPEGHWERRKEYYTDYWGWGLWIIFLTTEKIMFWRELIL